jgi:glutamyl-tRNA reductase
VESALMVIGVNDRTAPASVLLRYQITEARQPEELARLACAEGIEEVIVLATANCTEFWLWASDPTLAANSVSRLLSAEYGLKLREWEHFYRLLDDEALLHIFRAASELVSIASDATQIGSQVNAAWELAKKVGSSGRFLDTVVQKALVVVERVHTAVTVDCLKKDDPNKAVQTKAEASEAERILAAEARGFRQRLQAEQSVSTLVALRYRLDEFCRQELDSFREECGPFSKDQDEILHAVTSRLTQRIAGSLVRELREHREKVLQQQMTAAVQTLFHLETPQAALAGAKLEEERKAWPEKRPLMEKTIPGAEHKSIGAH